jgi:hypothetical protein
LIIRSPCARLAASPFSPENAKIRIENAWISSSTVGPRKSPRNVQVSRDVDRPVTIKAKVIEKIFSFREASASFQAERFFFCSDSSYRSAGDLACKRPVRAITVFFFVRAPVCFISLSFVSSSAARLPFLF